MTYPSKTLMWKCVSDGLNSVLMILLFQAQTESPSNYIINI